MKLNLKIKIPMIAIPVVWEIKSKTIIEITYHRILILTSI